MKVKVLIIDDAADIRRNLRQNLLHEKLDDWNTEFEVIEAENGIVGLESAQNELPDLILLDVIMPEIDGIEVCKQLRKQLKLQHCYVIMLTSMDEIEYKLEGFRAGADDYVVKPFDKRELLARIDRGIRHIQEKKRATIDSLTQLANRYTFETSLEYECRRTLRYKHPLSLIMIDLDHFKQVNDTYGHGTGDSVLVELAALIKKHSRNTDIPARWGGEEFMILLPETPLKNAHLLAERIRVIIEQYPFTDVGHLTASFGVAQLNADKDDLLQRADNALYEAKEAGRNMVKVN